MPRKRKKSALARKPSLVFTESPVHVQKNVPSPVLCARHPTTASSIPVEDLDNLHWVSPQFRSVRHSGGRGKPRVSRLRRHSIASHRNVASSIGNKENVPNIGPRGLSKFKSLKFFGDLTAVPSIVEDVEVTIDTDTATDDDGGKCAGYNYEINDKDSPCDGCTRYHESDTNLSVSMKNSGKLYLGASGSSTHQPKSGVRNSVDIEKTECETVTLEKKIHIEFTESFEENKDINGAQRRTSVKENPPIKRLFASQLPSKCGGGRKSCQDFNQNLDSVKHILDSDEEPTNSPGVRRSARIHHIQKMLQISDSPSSQRTQSLRKTILAPNTPENEYGWSKRKRQLIQYIKEKS